MNGQENHINDRPDAPFSLAVLAEPRRRASRLEKGALIMNECDRLLRLMPSLRDFFYLIERKGWWGINKELSADIKLVEDLTLWEETKKRFPKALLIEFANADFVDTDIFRPLGLAPRYVGIQIAAWQPFKRHELFVQAAALLRPQKFIKFGHFWQRRRFWEKTPESALRRETISAARQSGACIDFPYRFATGRHGLPVNPERVNRLINSARMGILTSVFEGVNRFKMECLSADIPVLVPQDTTNPTKKHINARTGLLFEPTPVKLAEAIEYVLGNYRQFSPRAYILENTGHKKALAKLREALQVLARRDRSSRDFAGIYFNGRNESLEWDEAKVLGTLRRLIAAV
ncbi:MAG: hypothetical protein WC453_03970 [Patescibacteria group bacterium]